MKLFEIIKNNKIYAFLFIFILLVNLAAFIVSTSQKEIDQEARSIKDGTLQSETDKPRIKTVLTKEKLEEQREKLNDLMKSNPVLYLFILFFELLILFVIILGFIFDGYFITRWFHKKPPDIHLFDRPESVWIISDIFRVILIFLSCGYAFAIMQGPFTRYIPILKNENFNMVFNTGVINVGAIAVIFFFVVKKYGQSLQTLGITFKKTISSIVIGITGYVMVLPVLFVIMILTLLIIKLINYEPPVQPIVELFMEEKETTVLGFSVLFAAICGPIAEEIFFRGFMYSALRKKLGILGSILITSVLFSLLHTHIIGFLPIMVLGILLAYLYEKTGSIIPSITVHIIHNVGTVFMVFIAKYMNA